MKFCQQLMRWLAPTCEIQRMELRHTVALASAHAEDLTRTLRLPQTAQALQTGRFKIKEM